MRSSRIPSLDGLRALSISLVLFSHFAESWHAPYRVWWVANDYGKVGLRIFYVISGFLITMLLVKERERTGAISLKTFYIRRVYRIFPAAYLYIIVVAAVFHASLAPKDIIIAFVYLSSYSTYIPLVLSHLWSLSVEEQFYVVWPAIMMLSLATGKRVAVCIVAIAPLFRFALLTAGLGDGPLFPVATSADALATGCLLALLQPELRRYRSFFAWRGFWSMWVLTGGVALFGLTNHARIYQCVGLPALHIGIALCIQNATVASYRLLNAAVPVWVGNLSYSLYLWHRPFADAGRHSLLTTFPGNVILTFVVAAISYYAVERPMLRVRELRLSRRSLILAGVSTYGASSET